MAETIQRIDSFDAEGALVERVELERIAGVVEYRHYSAAGPPDEQRPATPEETAAHEAWETGQNIDEVRRQASASLERNKDFLALDPPTNAQNIAQIEALTKQVNGLIRTLLDQFDDIEDSLL
jgi:hypothetical protein